MSEEIEKENAQENEIKKEQENKNVESADSTDKKADKKEKKEKKVKKKSKIEEAEEKVQELGAKLEEMNDRYMRLSAEFDNYRKRTLKEKSDLIKSAGERVFVDIFPVMDNFERAMQAMDKAEDKAAVVEGINLIYMNFADFLKRNGVEAIATENADFDTDLHEAITKIPAPSEEMKGKVVDCIEKGYKLNDKVVRYAKVVVGE